VLAGCGGGREALPGGPSSERVTLQTAGSVEGAPLGYVEYLPPGYGDGTSRPLLVFLHGVDENGDGSETALGRLFKLGVPRLIQKDDWPEDPTPVDVRLTVYPRTDHDAWSRTYDLSAGHDIYAWLLGNEHP
jgi:hypothetical protein